jgi:hypothetical protein
MSHGSRFQTERERRLRELALEVEPDEFPDVPTRTDIHVHVQQPHPPKTPRPAAPVESPSAWASAFATASRALPSQWPQVIALAIVVAGAVAAYVLTR